MARAGFTWDMPDGIPAEDLQPLQRKRSAMDELVYQRKLEIERVKRWAEENKDHPLYGGQGALWD